MSEMGLIETVAQVGFPIAVATWLLVKSYQQDQRYLEVLQKLCEKIERIEQCLEKQK